MVAVEKNEVGGREPVVPLIKPIDRSGHALRFVANAAPAKIKQIPTPNTQVRVLNRTLDQVVVFRCVTAIAEQVQIGNEGQSSDFLVAWQRLDHWFPVSSNAARRANAGCLCKAGFPEVKA